VESQNEKRDDIKEFLDRILELFDIQATIEVAEEPSLVTVNIEGEDLSILIGSRGRTLNALQQIVNVYANKGRDEWLKVIVDAQGYRERRRQTLEEYAKKMADQAASEKRTVPLEPMNSFERRIVHCSLLERQDIRTESQGEEPERYIVIIPEG
jgi:spoIIIJ-associated protein